VRRRRDETAQADRGRLNGRRWKADQARPQRQQLHLHLATCCGGQGMYLRVGPGRREHGGRNTAPPDGNAPQPFFSAIETRSIRASPVAIGERLMKVGGPRFEGEVGRRRDSGSRPPHRQRAGEGCVRFSKRPPPRPPSRRTRRTNSKATKQHKRRIGDVVLRIKRERDEHDGQGDAWPMPTV